MVGDTAAGVLWGGVLLAALSAFFNGTFGVLAKLPPVQRAHVSPLHFNFWVAQGLVISSVPLWLKYHVRRFASALKPTQTQSPSRVF